MKQEIKTRIEQIKRGEVPQGYRKGKLGIIPNEWHQVNFSTLFTSISDYTNNLGEYPLYSLTIEDGITAKTERYERSHLVKKENAYKIANPNDYAFNPMNIRLGAVARHKGDTSVAVSGYYDIFTTKKVEDLEFMDNFLTCSSMLTYYNKVSTGSLIEKQRVHFSQFINFDIELPPIEERKKIADILTTQDKVIELKEKLIAEKWQQKKWLMQNLLTGKKRLKGFGGEWDRVEISKHLKPSSKTAVSDTNKYKKITIKLNLKGIEYSNINREMADTRPFYVRKAGEIIIGKQNYFNGSIAILPVAFDGCICSNAIMSFDVKGANTNFIYEILSQIDFIEKRKHLANGTGQKELSEKEFLQFRIDLPPIHEQTAIAEILSTADREIELLQKDLAEEKQKKKALMQLLLTGIVRV
ncbi:MAG: restriction endonuclease subunit S [Filifactoraceae bacterium]